MSLYVYTYGYLSYIWLPFLQYSNVHSDAMYLPILHPPATDAALVKLPYSKEVAISTTSMGFCTNQESNPKGHGQQANHVGDLATGKPYGQYTYPIGP